MELIPKTAIGIEVVSVQTTELERLGMLKLFRINSKRLPTDYNPGQATLRPGMKISFTLPLGPIGMRDMGKLTNDSGCVLCGKTKVSRCVQCLAVSYCGKGVRLIFLLCGISNSFPRMSEDRLAEPQSHLPFLKGWHLAHHQL